MGSSTSYIGSGAGAIIISSSLAYIGGTMVKYPGTARTWAYTAKWPPHYYFPYTTTQTITVKVNAAQHYAEVVALTFATLGAGHNFMKESISTLSPNSAPA